MRKSKRVFRQGAHIRWDAADLLRMDGKRKSETPAFEAREAMIEKFSRPGNKPVTPEEAYRHMTKETFEGAAEARQRMIKRKYQSR